MAAAGSTTNHVLQAQINALGESMQSGLGEIKQILQGIEVRVREIENREAGCYPMVNSKVDAAWRRLDEHDVAIVRLREVVGELVHTNRLLGWAAGLVTAVLVVLLGALVTGQATIIFK